MNTVASDRLQAADGRSGSDQPGHVQPPATSNPRVIAALEEYMAAVEAGHAPYRREFLARHADIANVLTSCLEALDFVQSAASQLSQVADQPIPSPPSSDAFQTGVLGDFRLLREIGRGGMGVVYEAEQISLSRKVAVKVSPVGRRARSAPPATLQERGPRRRPARSSPHRRCSRRRRRPRRPLLRHAPDRRPDAGGDHRRLA